MSIITASIESPENFFHHFRASGWGRGERLCVSLHLIWKNSGEIPWVPDAFLVFPAAWWFSAPCQESEGFRRFLLSVSQDRIESVFLNNYFPWEGLWNALSRARRQLHSYLAALRPGITREPVATPRACVRVCLTLKSTCVIKCWRNARCFHRVIFLSRCAKFLWASALVYRCLNFSPSELVSVCWKLKAFYLLAVAWGGWTYMI